MGKRLEVATFAAGCFWEVEEGFRCLQGVVRTDVGYTGGTTRAPTYDEVCTGSTGHAEAVRVEFDPKAISYGKLLEEFFSMHDPTSKDRQGLDIGHQYRSAIFFHGKRQEKEAREAIGALEKTGKYWAPIVTNVEPAGKFWPAEEYHQKYLAKQGMKSCSI